MYSIPFPRLYEMRRDDMHVRVIPLAFVLFVCLFCFALLSGRSYPNFSFGSV